jgi:hypothetical protein
MKQIIWSDYIKYRANLRGFHLDIIEEILKFSGERYYDTETNRMIAVGKHERILVMIPYEDYNDRIEPITIHATSRQQIKFRVTTGRFIIDYE